MLFAFTSLIVLSAYLILIVTFTIGWKRIPYFEQKENSNPTLNISVVVACRNEEQNLYQLLAALKNQTTSAFQLVLVNDHSIDNTRKVMESAKFDFADIVILDAEGSGKKQALKQGILSARGDLIITTDADCIPECTWIETIGYFQHEFPSDLIICPVGISGNKTAFDQLQQLEFSTLVASGAGAAGVNMPIMCNGANLAFTKEAWLQSQHELHDEQISGDDMFLLLSVKKRRGVIRFLKSSKVFVSTSTTTTFKSFIRQRQRWTSKSTVYTDWQVIFTACTVFLVSLIQIALLAFSIYDLLYLYLFAVVFVVKYLADLLLLSKVSGFFELKHAVVNSFMLSLLYPFYIVVVAITGLMSKPVWK